MSTTTHRVALTDDAWTNVSERQFAPAPSSRAASRCGCIVGAGGYAPDADTPDYLLVAEAHKFTAEDSSGRRYVAARRSRRDRDHRTSRPGKDRDDGGLARLQIWGGPFHILRQWITVPRPCPPPRPPPDLPSPRRRPPGVRPSRRSGWRLLCVVESPPMPSHARRGTGCASAAIWNGCLRLSDAFGATIDELERCAAVLQQGRRDGAVDRGDGERRRSAFDPSGHSGATRPRKRAVRR